MARSILPNRLRQSMSWAVIALLLVATLLTGRTAPGPGDNRIHHRHSHRRERRSRSRSDSNDHADVDKRCPHRHHFGLRLLHGSAATAWQVPCLGRKGRLQPV